MNTYADSACLETDLGTNLDWSGRKFLLEASRKRVGQPLLWQILEYSLAYYSVF